MQMMPVLWCLRRHTQRESECVILRKSRFHLCRVSIHLICSQLFRLNNKELTLYDEMCEHWTHIIKHPNAMCKWFTDGLSILYGWRATIHLVPLNCFVVAFAVAFVLLAAKCHRIQKRWFYDYRSGIHSPYNGSVDNSYVVYRIVPLAWISFSTHHIL